MTTRTYGVRSGWPRHDWPTTVGVRGLAVVAALTLVAWAKPAAAQVDLSGEWAPVRAEDNVGNPELGDWVGLPLNDAARARSSAWDASIYTLPEWQCRPHGSAYISRGPSQLRIWRDVDPVSRDTTNWNLEWLRSVTRPVYMDGRPHPSPNSLHTWAGFSTGEWVGDTLGVGAAVLWGATTLTIRASALATAPPEKTLAYQLAISGVLLVLAALATGERWPAVMAPLSAGSMVFQTVVVTFASYLAWFWLMRHYPATRIASFTLLTPVAGLAFGVLLLHEPLTWRLLTALVAVAAGLVLVNRR